MLDVSSGYLLGIIDIPRSVEDQCSLTLEETKMLSMIRELNLEGHEAALAMISSLVSQGIYKKHSEDVMDTKKAAQ